MTLLGTPGHEEHRVRVGLIFLVVGLLLVLFAWGNWTFRASIPPDSAGVVAEAPEDTTNRARFVRLMPLVLLVATLLFLVFLAGSYVIMRAGRRKRELIYRRGRKPTASEDVWVMHKPPPATE